MPTFSPFVMMLPKVIMKGISKQLLSGFDIDFNIVDQAGNTPLHQIV